MPSLFRRRAEPATGSDVTQPPSRAAAGSDVITRNAATGTYALRICEDGEGPSTTLAAANATTLANSKGFGLKIGVAEARRFGINEEKRLGEEDLDEDDDYGDEEEEEEDFFDDGGGYYNDDELRRIVVRGKFCHGDDLD